MKLIRLDFIELSTRNHLDLDSFDQLVIIAFLKHLNYLKGIKINELYSSSTISFYGNLKKKLNCYKMLQLIPTTAISRFFADFKNRGRIKQTIICCKNSKLHINLVDSNWQSSSISCPMPVCGCIFFWTTDN